MWRYRIPLTISRRSGLVARCFRIFSIQSGHPEKGQKKQVVRLKKRRERTLIEIGFWDLRGMDSGFAVNNPGDLKLLPWWEAFPRQLLKNETIHYHPLAVPIGDPSCRGPGLPAGKNRLFQ